MEKDSRLKFHRRIIFFLIFIVSILIFNAQSNFNIPKVMAQTEDCGNWELELDQTDRIAVEQVAESDNSNCRGTFLFENQTGLSVYNLNIGGGYTLQLFPEFDRNSMPIWDCSGGAVDSDNNIILHPEIPGRLCIEPIDLSSSAITNISGKITWDSVLVDISLYLIESTFTYFAGDALTNCIVNPPQLLITAMAVSNLLDEPVSLIFDGELRKGWDKINVILPEFYELAAAHMESLGVNCAEDFLFDMVGIVNKPGNTIKIVSRLVAHIATYANDLWKYRNEEVIININYLPNPSSVDPVVTDDGKVFLGELLLLDIEIDAPGCFFVDKVSYAPNDEHLLITIGCFESDNLAFLFDSEGTNKTQITGEWDYLNYDYFAWSPDGQYLIYQRINSCCASEIPATAPPAGLVRYDVATDLEIVIGAGLGGNVPTWSPDSQWIAFWGRPFPALYITDAISGEIWLIDLPSSASELYWEIDETAETVYLSYLKGGEEQVVEVGHGTGNIPSNIFSSVESLEIFMVIGVSPGDSLNVRSEPGVLTDDSIVGVIPFFGADILKTGDGVVVGQSEWFPIKYGDIEGWVNSEFLTEQIFP